MTTATKKPPQVGQTTINQRFAMLISKLGINRSAFAASINKSATAIITVINGRNKPGFDVLEAVFLAYPEVSRDWLLMGEGQMFRSADEGDHPQEPEMVARFVSLAEAKDAQLAAANRQIEQQQEIIKMLAGKSEGTSRARKSRFVQKGQDVPSGVYSTPLIR